MQRGSNGIDLGEHWGGSGLVATNLVITHKQIRMKMSLFQCQFHCTYFSDKLQLIAWSHIHKRNINILFI